MARRFRCSDAGYVYHVLNRAVGRATLFSKGGDYAAFEKILCQAWERFSMRLLSYLIMPNHWHLVVWPEQAETLSAYVPWVTVTHVRRWHAHYHTGGTGPIYQGRFKSFPVQEDDPLVALRRSVVRGAPYGDELWQQRTAKMLGLESSMRPRGRPKKEKET